MGAGDKRSKKGKVRMGTYGKTRPKSANKKTYVPEKEEGQD